MLTFPPPIPTLPPGQLRFRYDSLIGRGGLGQVHRVTVLISNCETKPVGSQWAVKRLNDSWAAHAVAQRRFDREINAVKRMSHTNIMTFEGENLPGGERFYIMPLFSQSLRKFIHSARWRGNWRDVAKAGAILADALHHAHEQGFLHRDFKPDNVLFNPSGPLVIADWGLGYFIHRQSVVLQQLTVGGLGTEYYCSPEQWMTGKCDRGGDIYSLGMTLDEWVTGSQRPSRALQGLPAGAAPSGASTAGSRQFDDLLREMTQVARRLRPKTMAEVASVLRNAARML